MGETPMPHPPAPFETTLIRTTSNQNREVSQAPLSVRRFADKSVIQSLWKKAIPTSRLPGALQTSVPLHRKLNQ